MIKEPYSFRQFNSENQNTLVEKEKDIADYDKKKRIDEIFALVADYILENYIDESGNYRPLFDFANFKHHPEIKEEFKKIKKDISDIYPDFDFENILRSKNFIKLIIDKYNKDSGLFAKIKNIKLVNDIVLSKLTEADDDLGIEEVIDKSKEIADDPSEAYFVRTYAKTRYLSNLDWCSDIWLTRQDEADKVHDDWVDIREMHDEKFNNYQFEFQENVLDVIAEARGDHFVGKRPALSELKHIYKKSTEDIGDYEGDKPDFIYDGHYIACDLAPGIVGAYSLNGELLGWSNYNENVDNLKIDIKNQDSILDVIGDDSKENLVLFKMMSNLEFRSQIQKDFNFNLGRFNLRTQFQFLEFIKEASQEKVDKLSVFLNQDESKKIRENKVKSFLSLEQDPGMGEVILSIGEQLKDESEVADRLFAQYAEMVDGVEEPVNEIKEIVSDVFVGENIDESKVINTILRGANKLFVRALKDLEQDSTTDKKLIINELIADIKREKKIQKKNLENIVKNYEKLKEKLSGYLQTYALESGEYGGLDEVDDFDKLMYEEEDMLDSARVIMDYYASYETNKKNHEILLEIIDDYIESSPRTRYLDFEEQEKIRFSINHDIIERYGDRIDKEDIVKIITEYYNQKEKELEDDFDAIFTRFLKIILLMR